MKIDTSDQRLEAESARSGSVSETLAAELQSAILRGEFAVGSSLPSERELLVKFKVSRTSVREALRMLGAQGLVEVRRGRRGGSYVTSKLGNTLARSLDLFIKDQNIRFIDLVFARLAIEPAAASQAALSRTEGQLEEVRALCLECEQKCEDLDGFVAANLEWHRAVARASNNPLFDTFLTSISAALRVATDLDVFDLETRKAVVSVHWQIFEAIRQGDPTAARRRMERHLSAYSHTLSSIPLNSPRY